MKTGVWRIFSESRPTLFAGFGKSRIRFERRIDIHTALLKLAESIICSRFVEDLC